MSLHNSTDGDDARFHAALNQLKRNSRSAGVLTAVGGFVALAALGLSGWQVARLQSQRGHLVANVKELRRQEADLNKRVALLKGAVQAEEDKRELARAQIAQGNSQVAEQILDTSPHPSSMTGSGVAATPSRTDTPRVYFQIRSREQITEYSECAAALRPRGYRVPQYEVVTTGPVKSQVRYFRAEDRDRAIELVQATEACLATPVQLTPVFQYKGVSPLHFEVWVAPG